MPNDRERLLIKVILPKQGTERKQEGGGGSPEPFRPVNTVYRQSLSTRLAAMRTVVRQQSREIGAAPMRVKLIREALAKSHRPETLFDKATCPIIGSGSLGELFVKATPEGLDRLDRMVLRNTSKQVVKELSTIQTLEPITPQFRRKGIDSENILRHSPLKNGAYSTKVQLFDFGSDQQHQLVENFVNRCRASNVAVQRTGYSPESPFFEVLCRTTADVDAICNIVSVRSIKEMPIMNTISRQGLRTMPMPVNLPSPTPGTNTHPVVVVVDSGVSELVPELRPWIIGKTSNVAPAYQDPSHALPA